VRGMGRVCVRVSHKSCLIHFNLSVCNRAIHLTLVVSGRQPDTLIYSLCV